MRKCYLDNCPNTYVGGALLCKTHDRLITEYGSLEGAGGAPPTDPRLAAKVFHRPKCSAAGCNSVSRSRGLCRAHLDKRRRSLPVPDLLVDSTEFSVVGLCITPTRLGDPCAWRCAVGADDVDGLGEAWRRHLDRDHPLSGMQQAYNGRRQPFVDFSARELTSAYHTAQ